MVSKILISENLDVGNLPPPTLPPRQTILLPSDERKKEGRMEGMKEGRKEGMPEGMEDGCNDGMN